MPRRRPLESVLSDMADATGRRSAQARAVKAGVPRIDMRACAIALRCIDRKASGPPSFLRPIPCEVKGVVEETTVVAREAQGERVAKWSAQISERHGSRKPTDTLRHKNLYEAWQLPALPPQKARP